MDLGLSERVAVVTGGSSGIGAAIARCFAREGARVAIGYHANREAAEQYASSLGEAMVFEHDLREPLSIHKAIAAVLERWARLDILVSCAWESPGWAPPDSLPEAIPESAWQTQLRANVEGTAYVVQAALPAMRVRGFGRIVMVSSGAAEDGSPGLEQYATAKAALHGLSRSLARSAGPAGILVNLVMPGFVATERHRQSIPPEVFEQIASQTPTRRLATETDIAQLVTFLASEANGSVTGAEVGASGGLRL